MSTKATIVFNDDPDYHIYKDLSDWDESRGDGRVYIEICNKEGEVILDAPVESIDLKNKQVVYNFKAEIPNEALEVIKSMGLKFFNERS